MPPSPYALNHPARRSPAWFLRSLLITLVVVFSAQKILEIGGNSNFEIKFGALSISRLRDGYFWTLLTHALLHGNILHLLCNLTGLFFVGRPLEESIGSGRLAALSILGALGAGLVWLGLNGASPGYMIGASGIGMAYLGAFVAQDPRRPVGFPLWQGTVPVWWVLIGFIALDLAGLTLRAFTGREALSGVAHSAHLGGLATGWLCHRLFLTPRSLLNTLRPRLDTPHSATRDGRRPAIAYRVDLEPTKPHPAVYDTTRTEVNRLLDRISEHGYDTLSATERAFLAEAGRNLK